MLSEDALNYEINLNNADTTTHHGGGSCHSERDLHKKGSSPVGETTFKDIHAKSQPPIRSAADQVVLSVVEEDSDGGRYDMSMGVSTGGIPIQCCITHDYRDHQQHEVNNSNDDRENEELTTLEIAIVCVSFACLMLWLCYFSLSYVTSAVTALEDTGPTTAALILAILYFIVSFPFTWGYIILAIVGGYIYGFFLGLAMTILTSNLGVWSAHAVIFRTGIIQYLQRFEYVFPMKSSLTSSPPSLLAGVSKVLAKNPSQTKKIIFLTRLTPIPFGVQNTVLGFYSRSLSVGSYVLATSLGMLPCQVLNVYIGSTLRSIHEASDGSSHGMVAIAMLSFQICVVILLLTYMIKHAKEEIKKTTHENNRNCSTSNTTFNMDDQGGLVDTVKG